MSTKKNTIIFNITTIKAGERIDGVVLAEDKDHVKASGYTGSVNKFMDDLTTEEQETVLSVCKERKIKELQIANNENLKLGLEYPASSGNFFDLRNTKIQEYLGLIMFKDQFVYPYTMAGVGTSTATFDNSTEIDAFIGAALTAQGMIQQGRYVPAHSAVMSVTITTTLQDAIDQVNAVNY